MSDEKYRYPPCCPPEDREAFIRENAVAVVEQLEAKIARQRESIEKLEQTKASQKRGIASANATASRRTELLRKAVTLLTPFAEHEAIRDFLKSTEGQ